MMKVVKKGDLLIEGPPAVWQLYTESETKGNRCDYCFKRCSVKRCTACQIDYYCSRSCQSKAWKLNHKIECSKLKKEPKVPDAVRFLCKILIFLKKGGHDVSQKVDDNYYRKFSDLQTHETAVEDMPPYMLVLDQGVENYLGEGYFASREELLKVSSAMSVNVFTVSDSEEQQVLGCGLYLNGSVVDHSCAPNAIQGFQGTLLSIVALKDIPHFSWDKVRICYTDLLQSREDRRTYLKTKYSFDCYCERCESDYWTNMEDALQCGNPQCSGAVFIHSSPLQCTECSYSDFPSNTATKYNQFVAMAKEVTTSYKQIQKGFSPYAVFTRLFEMHDSLPLSTGGTTVVVGGTKRKLLHPKNLWLTKTQDEAMEAAINESLFEEALRLGALNVEGMKFYYGEYHTSYGIYLAKLGKLSKYLNKLEDAVKFFTLALESISVSIGKNNRTTVEINEQLQDTRVGINLQQRV